MVLLIGALHGFLLNLLAEWVDALQANWGSLSTIQKKYVTQQVYRRLEVVLNGTASADLADDKRQLQFLEGIRKSAEWYTNPSLLATAKDRYDLPEFFRDHGSKAIDKALAAFSDDPMLFFDWLNSRDPRHADYKDRLNNAIAIRNEAAHGIVNRRITLRDVRIYRVTVFRIVLHADVFVRRANAEPPIPPPAQ